MLLSKYRCLLQAHRKNELPMCTWQRSTCVVYTSLTSLNTHHCPTRPACCDLLDLSLYVYYEQTFGDTIRLKRLPKARRKTAGLRWLHLHHRHGKIGLM